MFNFINNFMRNAEQQKIENSSSSDEGKQNKEIVEQRPKDISNAWDSYMLEARSASGIFSNMSP